MFSKLSAICLLASVVQSQTCGGGSRGDGICAEAGLCCSEWGWCGSSTDHCAASSDTSVTSDSTSSPVIEVATGNTAPSGTCGGGTRGNGICADTNLCCSEWGWCGSSTDHCAASSDTAVTSESTSSPVTEVSTGDAVSTGTCGSGTRGNGICADTNLCCSEWGWCGASTDHCAVSTSTFAVTGSSGIESSGTANTESVNLMSSCTKPGMMAISIDDGVRKNDYMTKISDMNLDYPLTFYINGNNGGSYIPGADEEFKTAILNAMEKGHEIANHGYAHKDFTTLNAADLTAEISTMITAIEDVTGKKPAMLRCPYGACNQAVYDTAASLGIKAVTNWNYDTNDWRFDNSKDSADAIFKEFKAKLDASNPETDSLVVLMHAFSLIQGETNIPRMAQAAREKGFTLVSMSTCLGLDSPWQ